jgi:hypothetical protein
LQNTFAEIPALGRIRLFLARGQDLN